jgi:FtsH-binding integral membrane protein
MERKGKFLCCSPVCSLFTGGHGRARRRSWTSSLGCSASTFSMAQWTRRKRRRRSITTPHTTPGRPRARTRTKVFLRHTLETPLLGRVGRAGIDLHLGQKPKLGGRYADESLIYILYFVGPLYIYVSLSLFVLVLISTFQNTKRPKIFPLFLFVCLFSFLSLVCFVLYFRFDVWKIQNILLCLLFSSILVSKIKNPKIFVVLLRFWKVCCRVYSPMTPLDFGIHFILFKPHKWKGNNDNIWQSEMW